MSPSDETPLWQEIKRLREQLDYAEERHTAVLVNIRERILKLEAKLKLPPITDAVDSRPKPPIIQGTVPQSPRHAPEAAELGITPAPAHAAANRVPDTDAVSAAEPGKDGSFELDFGKVWFVRIGIVILLTGLIFLGNYAYQNWIREMPNGVRLASLFACAFALVETGRRLAAKENLGRFGEVLLAGGMAFFYYCTFAAHHVGRLKVIDSPIAGALLIFAAAGAIAAVSWLRKNQGTAILGIVLASYSTMLQPIGWMSCISSILLGAMGLFFMLRSAWVGPGWASMLGSYGAFFGWQVLGAAGKTLRVEDPAVLWFLPPLWVMFAIPGVLGHFRESLPDRARAWFTGANNALFFLLFSGIWIARNGGGDYWQVAAVFGSMLIALGIIGRRQSTAAGGVNISQGLAIATFAIVLKLEGQNLALVLAFESLALAIASWKYRGKSEAVFSLLAGLGSTGLVIYHHANNSLYSGIAYPPIWSTALVALLILVASRMAMRSENPHNMFPRFLRASAAILFTCSAALTTHICLDRLGKAPALLTGIIIALALSIAVIRFDKERRQPELLLGALWFLMLSVVLGFGTETAWPLALSALVSLAACWIWHQTEGPAENTGEDNQLDPRSPSIPAWGFSIATTLFAALTIGALRGTYAQTLIVGELAALVLAVIAVALRCKRLLLAASAMALLSLILAFRIGETHDFFFLVSLIALAPAAVIHLPWSRERLEERSRTVSSGFFRFTSFLAYCAAWHHFAPGSWSDWLAVTSIALTLLAFFLKRKLFPESVGLISVGLVAFFHAAATSPWHLAPEETGWRGITVVIALLALVLTYRQRPALIADPETRAHVISLIAGLACIVTTLWATQMLVWRFGWKPSAILWTVIGFGFVSAGLWQRLHIMRISGFLLLVISLIKLFAADVWDFTAFMRVVSFIVLGASLILLGLFYNRFSEGIKRLLDDEKGLRG